MRKVLLILDGIVAKDFLTTLTQKHIDKNYYIFVSLNPELLPQNLSEGNEAYNFDPCSPKKLQQVLEPQITDCYIITDQAEERELIYNIVRSYNKNIQITLLGELNLKEEDKQLTLINEAQILAAKLFERFPNVPRTAKYIGLGEGEIMQINVPFGSPYAYRTVGVIKQKKWKIVAIYRNKELILPKYSTVIFPNDSLLLVGEPKTLWDIYHRIKEEIGQFPTPFGRDVILYFDLLNSHSLEFYLEQTQLLFNNFKNKRLHFCFFNPNTPDIISTLHNNPILQQENITYHIEFYETSLKNILAKDIQNKNIGLILSESVVFEKYKNILFESGIPLFKFGSTPLEQITHSAVVIPKITEEAEKISSVVFDFSTQLGLKIRLYDFDPDENYHKLAIEYYKHIEKIFEKKIEIIQSNSLNPILWLNQQKNTLQILPLKKERIKKSVWFNLTDIENLSSHLSNLPQLFIPLSV
ncbi:TrkA C-terminal domain-containing protein [Helicobacter burdigaliensis]|uniref:TrkA C-terminal domain-containing protein n=1 Tax=Helicobacter burdigaliensis TaxID=2315334 RepID=UPI000EF73877|nr:TrkA C-terminal domain-containing protein [Helicobacter burdigaliensis]